MRRGDVDKYAAPGADFQKHPLIVQQIRHKKFGVAGLADAQPFDRAAHFQVPLCDKKAVVSVAQNLQTRQRGFTQRQFVQQYAVGGTAPRPTRPRN